MGIEHLQHIDSLQMKALRRFIWISGYPPTGLAKAMILSFNLGGIYVFEDICKHKAVVLFRKQFEDICRKQVVLVKLHRSFFELWVMVTLVEL